MKKYLNFLRVSGLGVILGLGLWLFSAHTAQAVSLSTFVELSAESSSDSVGAFVSSFGDVNGDGYDDVLIGAPDRSVGGSAYLVYGQASSVSSATLSSAVEFTGEVSNDDAGASVAIIGDVNGDGYDDILIGAHTNDDAGSSAGSVYLIYGQAAALSSSALSSAIEFTGPAAGAHAGYFVSPAGNVNGDAYDDFLVGAYGVSSSAGVAYLIYGQAASFSSGTLASAGLAFTGETAGDNAGFALSDAGDVNADGYDDFLVGAINNDSAASNAGAAYLVYGQAATLSSASLGSHVRFSGEASSDSAGNWTAPAGDVDGDGYDDFLVGAPTNDDGGAASAGAAYLVYGRAAAFSSASLSTAVEFTGTGSNDQVGYPVGRGGDMNNDGYDDILLGSVNLGTTYLIYGNASKLVSASVSTATAFVEETTGDAAATVVTGGDLNGDSFYDLVIGAPDVSSGAGAVFIGYLYMDSDRDGTAGTGGLLALGTDCNDSDATVTTNQTYYQDVDGDGLGSDTTTSVCSSSAPAGYVANSNDANDTDYDNDGSPTGTDCSDTDATVTTDQTYYQDSDGDGLGSDTTTSVCSSTAPAGFVANSNDTNDSISNAGVEIDGDGVDNDGDGTIDEVNTISENGEHPEFGSTDPTDTTAYAANIVSIAGAKRGKIRVTYADNSVYVYRIFTQYDGTEKTKVKSFNATGHVVVLHPKAKKLALVNVYDGEVFDRQKLSTKKFNKSALKMLDVRHDGSTEAVVVAKKKALVKVSVVKVKPATHALVKKDSASVQNSTIVPKKTKAVKKQLRLRNSNGAVVEWFRVTQKYKLILL